MLSRVQRELATVHPLSLYRKQDISRPSGQSSRSHINRLSQSCGLCNGGVNGVVGESTAGQSVTNNISAKRKIQKIINEVKEKRELRERKKSEMQGLNGSDLELDGYLDPEFTKTKYYKEKLAVYSFLNSPQVSRHLHAQLQMLQTL